MSALCKSFLGTCTQEEKWEAGAGAHLECYKSMAFSTKLHDLSFSTLILVSLSW